MKRNKRFHQIDNGFIFDCLSLEYFAFKRLLAITFTGLPCIFMN